MANTHATLDKIVSWAKRRGFVYQTSDIYGGLANNYDYGPYGTQLKNNIRDLWWKRFVSEREDIVGLDGAIITHPRVWDASGHTTSFSDPLVEDAKNHKRYRADHVIEDYIKRKGIGVVNRESANKGYKGGSISKGAIASIMGEETMEKLVEEMTLEEMDDFIEEHKILSPDGNPLTKAKNFNLLFETHIGAVEGDKDIAYLRGETAQSIFQNYANVIDTMRVKVPFGIAQIGKAFRNEITKGQFIFRTIEFEQMEIEYFIHPEADWEPMMEDWLQKMKQFYIDLGAPEDDVRFRQHTDEELSHYSKRTYDPEYEFDFGWKEIAGLAHRTDYDLSRHTEYSGKKLIYRDPYTNEVYTPHVLEPSMGVTRAVLVAMYSAYTEEDLGEGKSRVVMKFPPVIAPVKAAIFPLQKDEKLADMAQEVFNSLKTEFVCEFDNAGNIGKMYRRQDEIGTPFCITVDFDSLDDQSVTVRDRDSMEQERVKVVDLPDYLAERLS